MTTLLTVPDIMARYKCCRQTAAALMHEMEHLERPRLLVPEWAVEAWERQQMAPQPAKLAPLRQGRVLTKEQAQGHKIPRRRPETA